MSPATARGAVGAALIFAASGCADRLSPELLEPITFAARPSTVRPGDSLEVVFTLRNRTAGRLELGSPMGCLYFLEALRDGQTVLMGGTNYACIAVGRTFTIGPWDSLRIVPRLVATDEGRANSPPLDAGTYHIVTRMNADLPPMETTVTVRP